LLNLLEDEVYVQEPLVADRQMTCLFCHSFNVLLEHTEKIWNKEYNSNYLYELLTITEVAPEAIYSLLPMMKKSVHTIVIT